MSFQFDAKAFDGARKLPLLVVIDPMQRHLAHRNGLGRTNLGGIVANCQKAVARGREMGLSIAFIRDFEDSGAVWISGLAPQRDDMVFERRSQSCYSARYFGEVAKRAGSLLVAGFPGDGGALAIAADTIRAGQRVTFLQDALLDAMSKRLLTAPVLEACAEHPELGIAATSTYRWFYAAALGQKLGTPALHVSP